MPNHLKADLGALVLLAGAVGGARVATVGGSPARARVVTAPAGAAPVNLASSPASPPPVDAAEESATPPSAPTTPMGDLATYLNRLSAANAGDARLARLAQSVDSLVAQVAATPRPGDVTVPAPAAGPGTPVAVLLAAARYADRLAAANPADTLLGQLGRWISAIVTEAAAPPTTVPATTMPPRAPATAPAGAHGGHEPGPGGKAASEGDHGPRPTHGRGGRG